MRHSKRWPQIGCLEVGPKREFMQAEQKYDEARRIAPIDKDPEVILTWFRSHCLARKQGSFEFSGYCFGRVPHSGRKCILFPPLKKKKKRNVRLSHLKNHDQGKFCRLHSIKLKQTMRIFNKIFNNFSVILIRIKLF